MTTQTVTIVFTDLVGSTELSARLGPVATEDLRLTHFGLLRGAIQASGGTEVKNMGDGLMVAFSSLSRALACAVGMQQAIERHNRRDRVVPLSVRIGMATGEATEEDGDYFGDPVVEAARLCAQADGGQILATEIVKAMAGRHATQEFISVGDLVLKGLPDPVPAVEVLWEPDTAAQKTDGQLPLPARLVGASAESLFAFFGRADELSRLADIQKVTSAEHRLRVTLVSGEPGIGKTTLVAQAARAVHAAGASVCYGNCTESLAIPYQPWIAALTQLVDHTDEAVLSGFVDGNGPALARLLPGLARRLGSDLVRPDGDPDTERFLILEGVARFLALASTTVPLVLVLDDLHWVDAASLELLRHLVTSATPMAVQVVGTFRESDLSRSHPLTGALAELRREPAVDRLDLLGLADTEIIDLLAAAAGHDMEDEGVALAHALRRETGGNPFFLVEVVRHLAETGAFVQDADGRWVLSVDLDALGLPRSVREVVAHRVARLGTDAEQALGVASVIGREFDLEVLSQVLDADEERLLDLLEAAIGAGLLDESEQVGGHYRFVHALIQHTLYQELSTTRRQRAHQRVAEALEAGGAVDDTRVTELARHWTAATRPADGTKALHYLRRAGDAALNALAPLDAINWYVQALELQGRQDQIDHQVHCALLVGLGTAQYQAGLPEHRMTLSEAAALARDIGDAGLLVTAALAAVRGGGSTGAGTERIELLESALAAVGRSDEADRARLLVALSEATDALDVGRRQHLADEAVGLARALDDDPLTLEVLTNSYMFRKRPENSAELLAETASIVALADRIGQPMMRFRARFNRIWSCMEVGDVDEVRRRHEEMRVLETQTGLPYFRWQVLLNEVALSTLEGDLEGAEATNAEALEIGSRIGAPEAFAAYGGSLCRIRVDQGRPDEIVELMQQVAAENQSLPIMRIVLGILYLDLGRDDELRQLFAPDVANGFADHPRDSSWMSTIINCGDIAAHLGDVAAARTLYDMVLPFADQVAYPGAVINGSARRPLGRLAHLLDIPADAEVHFGSALAMHECMGSPYWSARTKLDFADFLVDRNGTGDRQRATQMVSDALDSAETHGFAGLMARSRALLDSIR